MIADATRSYRPGGEAMSSVEAAASIRGRILRRRNPRTGVRERMAARQGAGAQSGRGHRKGRRRSSSLGRRRAQAMRRDAEIGIPGIGVPAPPTLMAGMQNLKSFFP